MNFLWKVFFFTGLLMHVGFSAHATCSLNCSAQPILTDDSYNDVPDAGVSDCYDPPIGDDICNGDTNCTPAPYAVDWLYPTEEKLHIKALCEQTCSPPGGPADTSDVEPDLASLSLVPGATHGSFEKLRGMCGNNYLYRYSDLMPAGGPHDIRSNMGGFSTNMAKVTFVDGLAYDLPDAGVFDDAGPESEQTDAGTEPPDDGEDAGTEEPPDDGEDAGIEPPDDGEDAGTEPPDEGEDAGTEPPDDSEDAGTEPPDDGEDAGTSSYVDCFGEEWGSAYYDNCGYCVGGMTGELPCDNTWDAGEESSAVTDAGLIEETATDAGEDDSALVDAGTTEEESMDAGEAMTTSDGGQDEEPVAQADAGEESESPQDAGMDEETETEDEEELALIPLDATDTSGGCDCDTSNAPEGVFLLSFLLLWGVRRRRQP